LISAKMNTMVCALLAAMLVIVTSVLAPPISAPEISSAEASAGGQPLALQTPVPLGGLDDSSSATAVVALSLGEVLSAVATPAPATEAPSQDADERLHPLEARLLGLLNRERILHGLAPLQVDHRLVGIARERSRDMAARDYFSHVTPEGSMVFEAMDEQGVAYFLAGENLARNRFPPAESPEVAHRGFMNSPPHRENELEPSFNRVGIGVAFSESGTIYFTELFIAAR
jgi:uncharacterized protein YkwD